MIRETSAGGVLLYDDKVLILRKPNGEWIMPKGHIEPGETPEQAALREVREETGLDATIIRRAGRTRYAFRTPLNGDLRLKTVHWFLMKCNGRQVVLESTFAEATFLGFEQALDTLTFENDREIVKRAMTMRKRMRK